MFIFFSLRSIEKSNESSYLELFGSIPFFSRYIQKKSERLMTFKHVIIVLKVDILL